MLHGESCDGCVPGVHYELEAGRHVPSAAQRAVLLGRGANPIGARAVHTEEAPAEEERKRVHSNLNYRAIKIVKLL